MVNKAAAALVLIFCATPVAAEELFSWTGRYEGYFVCDHVEDGVASTFGRPFELHIVQDGNVINIGTGTAEQAASGEGTSLYHGLVMDSPSGGFTSGFIESCKSRYPYKELIRIFPATTREEDFAFSANTVFVTDSLPGSEGKLVVESCQWSARRVSVEEPEIQFCDAPPSARKLN